MDDNKTCEDSKTVVRYPAGGTDSFKVEEGLH